MFGLSIEHILVLLVILIIFGPKRLPELGNTFGKAIRNFKDSISGVENAKFRKISDPEVNEGQTQASTRASTTGPEIQKEAPKLSQTGPSETILEMNSSEEPLLTPQQRAEEPSKNVIG